MNRLHVHLTVRDIEQSVGFYSALFGSSPARQETDYAKWMLEDPKVNFAISTHGEPGLSHLGLQVEDEAGLSAATARARAAAGSVMIEEGAKCCYARGEKAWVEDPQGVRWETFLTTGDLTRYGEGADATRVETVQAAASDACAPGCCG